MTFERTRNWLMIRALLTHRTIYPYVTDDFAGPAETFQINQHPAIWYVQVRSYESRLLGLFTLMPENDICWQVHVAMLRGNHPHENQQAGREIVPWLWDSTPCRRLVASVPECNRAAVRFGRDPCGMSLKPYGVNWASFQKHGRLWNQVLMGRSRP